MDIYTVKAKHADYHFSSAVAAVKWHIDETYFYEDDDALMTRASAIVQEADERGALRLLMERADYEYEGFEVDRVRAEVGHG